MHMLPQREGCNHRVGTKFLTKPVLTKPCICAVPLCSLPSDLWRVTALDRLDLSGNLFSGVWVGMTLVLCCYRVQQGFGTFFYACYCLSILCSSSHHLSLNVLYNMPDLLSMQALCRQTSAPPRSTARSPTSF